MKLKRWARRSLVAITFICLILTFIDNMVVNWVALAIAGACAYLYGKYSKLEG